MAGRSCGKKAYYRMEGTPTNEMTGGLRGVLEEGRVLGSCRKARVVRTTSKRPTDEERLHTVKAQSVQASV